MACLTFAAEPAAQSVVATVHPLATDAGVEALRQGGNAVDAAVAAALMLGVVDGHNSGIGGGCFILIRTADGKFAAIDGREMAPAKAGRDMFVKHGQADPELSQTGALAAAVPGALAAYNHALKKYGRRSLQDALLPAAEVAERGFAIDRIFARNLKSTAEKLARFESSRHVLLKPDGKAYAEGETLKQPDLARTYRAVAKEGIEWFYDGAFASATQKWMEANGGLLTAQDFATYKIRRREPLVTSYRGYTIVGFPPPSSGGVHVAQMLNVLEQYDLKALRDTDRADYVHVVAEAMKLAFADRAHWLGDPDFAKVPRGLASREYGAELAKRIDPKRPSPIVSHGTPPKWDQDFFGRQGAQKHTTHIAAADRDGNWVAITATVNTSFGSKVIVPGTGVILNNQMDDFSIQPGVPNAFGLVGASANAIEPGKRPLSSMSPTIVLKDGEPVMTIGAAGGPTIISQVVLGLVNQIDFGMPVDAALAEPRFHHQWSPDELVVEDNMPMVVVNELARRGHKITRRSTIGVSQAIRRDPDGTLRGAFDPRVPGRAAGFARNEPAAQLDPAAATELIALWKLETLQLKDGNEYHGVILEEREGAIEFADIVRPPGKRLFTVVRPVETRLIVARQRLPDAEHAELLARFQRIRSRSLVEAADMRQVPLDETDHQGTHFRIFAGPGFSVFSTADEEMTRRCVVRIDQIFRAYRQVLPPRRQPPRRQPSPPLRVILFGTLDEYRGYLQQRELAIRGPAFYSVSRNSIVSGCDLTRFGEHLAEARAENEKRRKQFEQLNRDLTLELRRLAGELRANGVADKQIDDEMRLRRNLWKVELDATLAKITETDRRNMAKFDGLTTQMFRRLYHEAFHAYLDNFVYPHTEFETPRWLNEGLAQIFESGQLEDGALRVDAPDRELLRQLQADLAGRQPLSLADLLAAEEPAFLVTHTDGSSQRHYLYSWGLAYYLTFQHNLLGGDELDGYVTLDAAQLGPVPRFERLVGQGLSPFELRWREYMRQLKPPK